MRRAWFVLAGALLAGSFSTARAASIKIVFERQGGQAVDWTPAAPVKRTLGIAWDERARADGRTAVFARSVTVTYSLAPGLSLSEAERRAFVRALEASLKDRLPSSPVALPADDDVVAEYRSGVADGLMRVISSRGPRLASAAPLELPAQPVALVP